MDQGHSDKKPTVKWATRAAWFLGLWVAGVAVVGTVAYAIRAMIL